MRETGGRGEQKEEQVREVTAHFQNGHEINLKRPADNITEEYIRYSINIYTTYIT
jgi:hypothetical protein